MMDLAVDLSRIQFGMTAIFHFMFVPLTLGLSWVLVVMEALYLKTGNIVFKDMTRFWGKLFAINFAMGVVTGITLEFEFGTNWSYFSRLVGDSFGTALAIEGVTAFMLEATLFGIFFFAWDKISKRAHFTATTCMAIGTNLSILNILVANSWMQHPIASAIDFSTMTMKLQSLAVLYSQSLAQIRFGHVLLGGLVTGSAFVVGISSYYLIKRQDFGFAHRSFAVGVSMGLCSALFVFFLGDANGLAVAKEEPMKMAAIEGQWTTQKAPASWLPVALPDQAEEKNNGVLVRIPYMLSLIAHHNLTGTVTGVKELKAMHRQWIEQGHQAFKSLKALRMGAANAYDRQVLQKYGNVIGYGFLLDRFAQNPDHPTEAEKARVMDETVPQVSTIFWSFRVMLAAWGYCFLVMLLGFIFALGGKLYQHRWFLRLAIWGIPMPFIAAEAGWVLAEVGRQPWIVHNILPTYDGHSSLSWQPLLFTVIGFLLFYGALACIELWLMFRNARIGPSVLGEGRYYYESLYGKS